MTLKPHFRPALLALALLLVASGCARNPPPPETYHLEAQRTQVRSPQKFADTLQINLPRSLSAYSGIAFVYQEGPQRYAQDDFRLYTAPLPVALQEQLTIWLTRSGLFEHVVPNSAWQARYVLDVEIRDISVDVRTDTPHTATVQFHARLRDTQANQYMLDQTFSGQAVASSPLDGGAIIAAQSQALKLALQALETALVATP